MPRRSGHFVVCGDDPLAALVVEELRRLDEDVVVIVPTRHSALAREIRAHGATLVEAERPDGEAFRRARLSSAHALALVRQDDVGNIHAALEAQEQNPDLRIVIRMYSTRLGERVRSLFDDCAVLSDSAMAAPLFVAAALGELAASHVEVAGRTLVVTRRDADRPDRHGTPPEDVVCALADTRAPGGLRLLPDDPDDADIVLAAATGRPAPLARHTRRRLATVLTTARAMVHHRLRYALAALVALLAAGTLLYTVFGPYSWFDAVYATLLTTAGSGDITLDSAGWLKIIQVAMTVVGLTTVPVITAAVVDGVVSVRLARALGAQTGRMERHIVVCGLGNVGSRVVEQLHALGVPVVAVEKDESAPGVRMVRRLGVPLVLGDASMEETLRSARVEHCRCVVSLTNDDVANLEVGLSTRTLRADVRVVLRLLDTDLATRVERQFGIETSRSVAMLAAPAFTAAMLERRLVATIALGRRVLVVADVPVAPTSALDGAPVSDANQAGNTRVLAVVRDEEVFWAPHPGMVLGAGDRLLLLATRSGLGHILVARAPVIPLTSGNAP